MLIDTLRLTLGYEVKLAPSFAGLRSSMEDLGIHRAVVVTNPVVRELHGESLAHELGGVAPKWVVIPDGESFKTVESWQLVVNGILASRPDRTTGVVAFGGGVVGDVAGFAAAVTLRGLPLVQLPTTLLAMVDSSVGGKTGVNVPEGKNLIGAFHQPRLVWAAQHTLATLPPRELRCGFGEILKHAILESEQAVEALEEGASRLNAADPEALLAAVARSVRLKASIVEQDPHERGVRATLNLGHTLGHAIERVAGYGSWSHGEAVALGLVAICRYSDRRGISTVTGFSARITQLAADLGLRTRLTEGFDSAALVDAMGFDKKRERGMVRLVIPQSPGQVQVRRVAHADLLELCSAARGES